MDFVSTFSPHLVVDLGGKTFKFARATMKTWARWMETIRRDRVKVALAQLDYKATDAQRNDVKLSVGTQVVPLGEVVYTVTNSPTHIVPFLVEQLTEGTPELGEGDARDLVNSLPVNDIQQLAYIVSSQPDKADTDPLLLPLSRQRAKDAEKASQSQGGTTPPAESGPSFTA